ncbi:MAG: cobalamin biosynthesis protein CbiG, partial [Desulfobacterales bacterium]|nr:cobalamin biosynthesis protein CbiG [Desulfobacterales bacterium]
MQHNAGDTPSFAVWAITPNGIDIGCSLVTHLSSATLFLPKKLAEAVSTARNRIFFSVLSEELTRQFHRFSGHVFIFSTGIAVRMIAPLLVSKVTDPSVVVVDDNGRHAVSLLSGHMGGGNELAKTIARITNGTPVITTATDVNQVPAIDMIALSRNLFIETVENIKLVNMAFLTGRPLRIEDPQNHILPDIPKKFISSQGTPKNSGPDIFCSYKTKTVSR